MASLNTNEEEPMSELTTFTEHFDAVVAEYGRDHVYQRPEPDNDGRCYYAWNGEASCLIGKTLFAMGFALAVLSQQDNADTAQASEVMRRLGVGTVPERAAADAAQRKQDLSYTWGQAQDEYHRVLDLEEALADA